MMGVYFDCKMLLKAHIHLLIKTFVLWLLCSGLWLCFNEVQFEFVDKRKLLP